MLQAPVAGCSSEGLNFCGTWPTRVFAAGCGSAAARTFGPVAGERSVRCRTKFAPSPQGANNGFVHWCIRWIEESVPDRQPQRPSSPHWHKGWSMCRTSCSSCKCISSRSPTTTQGRCRATLMRYRRPAASCIRRSPTSSMSPVPCARFPFSQEKGELRRTAEIRQPARMA